MGCIQFNPLPQFDYIAILNQGFPAMGGLMFCRSPR
jgi:hypothetical protein